MRVPTAADAVTAHGAAVARHVEERPYRPQDRRGAAILTSKLVPPEPAHATVARPRLGTLVDRHVQHSPVTLLSGPAGSGKTVLAAQWHAGQSAARPVGWLSLDQYDDDPATFWTYVLETVSRAGVPVTAVPELVPGEPLPGRLVAGLAADISASSRPVVLVLDDADSLTDRSITSGLDLLVRNAGHRLRLVLCGRADPLLPLHRYRLDGVLAEIRTDELAFTPEETRELFSALGAPVTEEVARGLAAETRGWAVGLRLAAAPLKQGVAPEDLYTSLARDDGSVAQYLFEEVFKDQPAGIRRILERISVTDELWPDLVERLCGRPNVRRVLTGLVHANAFVEASPGVPGGFRIHPLFQEMLQAQLIYDHPGELAGLHRTCARWYADRHDTTTALDHAVAASDWALVARLLVDDLWVPRVLAHGTDHVPGGLRPVPADVPGAAAAVVRTVAAVAGGSRPSPADVAVAAGVRDSGERIELRLSAGLAGLVAGADAGRPPSALLADVDAVAALVAQLPEDQAQVRRECAAVLGHQRAMAVAATDVAVDQLLVVLRAAVTAAQGAGARRLRARAAGLLALVEAVTGHLTRAGQLAGSAEAFAAEEGAEGARRESAPALALAWTHLRRYELVEARDWLVRVRERTPGGSSRLPGVEALHAVLLAQQLRLRHEHEAAEQALRPFAEADGLPRWLREQVVPEAVRLQVARGRTAEALRLLDRAGPGERWAARLRVTVALVTGAPVPELLPPAGPGAVPADAVETSVLMACQHLEAGRLTTAVDELGAALDLARPELQRWPFVDTPPQARRLLRTQQRLHGPGAWLSPSSGARPKPGTAPAARPAVTAPLVQDLSDRELEVLRYLAEMLSTAEIAAAMFISVNTVRTHIRSILRKLSVGRRNQAVRKARERGLLG
ncbi:LuxR C-terminal-related transcriptional regulator [Blastococcus litoris]|uniref:LuxR C-terminal-related transcriptional regulator n=1 Tax=Blastococcus litoris TaxID=2171622 RepID=UPI000E30A00C|nr:LuxR C-terminal-related transcriptional regulator [Blastococcus litoris]